MGQKDAQDLKNELLALVDVKAAGELADQIQKRAKVAPALTVQCLFSMPQRLKRLSTLHPRAWGNIEKRWAAQALEEIARLDAQKGHAPTLALACFGIRRKDLQKALDALEREMGAGQTVEEDSDDRPQVDLEALQAEVDALR